MRGVDPPDDSEEDSPRGGDDVVREEEVREVKRAARIFLRVVGASERGRRRTSKGLARTSETALMAHPNATRVRTE